MYIICGLGNPGREYEKTRHNTGFAVIDKLADRLGVKVERIRSKALTGEAVVNGEKILLIKPQTFMNLSGEALLPISAFYKVPSENIIIIYDDSDIPVGSIRLRAFGSAGSHNGMKSVISCMGTDRLPRIRVGIGSKTDDDMARFVLSRPPQSEQKLFDESISDAADAALCFVEDGIDKAMNKYNTRSSKTENPKTEEKNDN